MAAYYNEFEPYAAEWLRNLIKAGYIPDGEVDTRSIVDVQPLELRGFTQCHFFAGIGGWGYALRLAGWPDDRPIWTGSCPCQPFSVAGKGAGTDDPRHLWPHFHRLIAANRPPVVMGEQVAGQAGYGWFDGVRADLAREGYASRGVDIPACSVDAPHIRQRLYWVATDVENTSHHRAGGDVGAFGDGGRSTLDTGPEGLRQAHRQGGADRLDARSVGHMADARHDESQGWIAGQNTSTGSSAGNSTWNEPASCRISHGDSHMADTDHESVRGGRPAEAHGPETSDAGEAQQREWVRSDTRTDGFGGSGFWADHVWLAGADGKSRRARANISLLAHGLSDNVGRMCPEGYAQEVEKVDEYAQKTGQSRSEAMSSVWQIISQEPEAFWPVGECAGVSPQEVLLPFLRELLSACDAAGSIVQGQKVQEGEVRGLRDREETTRSPHRRGSVEQRPGEHSDPMRELSWVLAQHARALWETYWRANATAYPLLSHGEKNRVGRLRAYGNAIVPQVAAEVIAAYMESV